MTIEEMKQKKQQLTYDIAALVQTFEHESKMAVEKIDVKRYRGVQLDASGSSAFTGVEVEVSLNR